MIVDASVLAKLFVAEDLSEEARRIVGAAVEVWVPGHALAEMAEVICRKTALGQITPDQGMLALSSAIRLVRSVPLDGLLLPAATIAGELGVAVYDALYLALAEARADELVTWDKRLLRRVQNTRFQHIAKPLQASWKP